MQTVLLILVPIFTVVNLVIYHKIFSVMYFDLSQGLFKELVTAFIIAIFESALLVYFAISILKVVIIIAIIIACIIAIIKIAAVVIEKKEEKNKTEFAEEQDVTSEMQEDESVFETKNASENTSEENDNRVNNENISANGKIKCPWCGKEISATAKFCNYCGMNIGHKKKY